MSDRETARSSSLESASPPEHGGIAEALLALKVSIEGVDSKVSDWLKRRQRLIASIHPFNVGELPAVTSGSGLGLDNPDLLGPHAGYAWSVHTVICSGFTAGSVAMFTGGTNLSAAANGQGNLEFNFTSAGQLTYGKGQLTMLPGDRLTFYGTGITGAVNVKVRGIEMELSVLPDYLV